MHKAASRYMYTSCSTQRGQNLTNQHTDRHSQKLYWQQTSVQPSTRGWCRPAALCGCIVATVSREGQMPLLLFAGKAADPFRRSASCRVRVGLRAVIRVPPMGPRPARIAVLRGPLRRCGHTLHWVLCAHPAIGPWIALSLPGLANPALPGRVSSGVGCAVRCGVRPWVAAGLLVPSRLPPRRASSRRLWH